VNPVKIILLLVAIGVAWYGWQIWRKKKIAAEQAQARRDVRAIQDMVACPHCGVYLPAGSNHDCQEKTGQNTR
jgi:adenine-specific DNA methylase